MLMINLVVVLTKILWNDNMGFNLQDPMNLITIRLR